jgi:hypothetical protein
VVVANCRDGTLESKVIGGGRSSFFAREAIRTLSGIHFRSPREYPVASGWSALLIKLCRFNIEFVVFCMGGTNDP